MRRRSTWDDDGERITVDRNRRCKKKESRIHVTRKIYTLAFENRHSLGSTVPMTSRPRKVGDPARFGFYYWQARAAGLNSNIHGGSQKALSPTNILKP
jgi:hypothetical protein